MVGIGKWVGKVNTLVFKGEITVDIKDNRPVFLDGNIRIFGSKTGNHFIPHVGPGEILTASPENERFVGIYAFVSKEPVVQMRGTVDFAEKYGQRFLALQAG